MLEPPFWGRSVIWRKWHQQTKSPDRKDRAFWLVWQSRSSDFAAERHPSHAQREKRQRRRLGDGLGAILLFQSRVIAFRRVVDIHREGIRAVALPQTIAIFPLLAPDDVGEGLIDRRGAVEDAIDVEGERVIRAMEITNS